MTRGEKIRALRKERGLTQVELAEKIKVDKNTISKAEQNGNISNTTMELFAKEFKVSLDYLKSEDVENTTNENIEINKMLGFSDETISKLKAVKYKNDLNILLESLNYGFISYTLNALAGLQNYYETLNMLLYSSHKEISEFISQIDIGTRESYYGSYVDVYDTITSIINDFKNTPNLNIRKKYEKTIIVSMNRVYESMDYLKYRISTDIHNELDNIYKVYYTI